VGDGHTTGLLLAAEPGAIVRGDAGRHDAAHGFVTVAIVLRDRVRQGEWPERLSYDSTARNLHIRRRADQLAAGATLRIRASWSSVARRCPTPAVRRW
jgi:hypothetical protein